MQMPAGWEGSRSKWQGERLSSFGLEAEEVCRNDDSEQPSRSRKSFVGFHHSNVRQEVSFKILYFLFSIYLLLYIGQYKDSKSLEMQVQKALALRLLSERN